MTKHQPKAAFRLLAEVRFKTSRDADELRVQSEFSFDIDRGITVEGWSSFVDGKYQNVGFESAFLSR